MNKPIYVVQTQVISLGGKPFLLEDEVKSPFRDLFTSKTCFTDLRQSILDSSRYIQLEDSYEDGHWQIHKPQLIPLPGKPFIPGWSQVCFNTRSLLFSVTEERTELAQKLAQREMFWDRKAKKAKVSVEPDVFGFDPHLDDQRMNMLYFEIYNPLYLTASYKNKKMASGRVFLHIYPGGYLVLHLAVRFNENIIENKENLIKAVHETQPWRKNLNWEWDSRITHGGLDKIISYLQKITISSIMQQGTQKRIVKRNWFTSIKIFEDWDMQDLAKSLFDKNIKAVELKRYENELNYYDVPYEQDDYQNANEGTHVERGLVVSREGVILCLPDYFRRKKHWGSFGKSSKWLNSP